jgi:AcrR family transcriptional regulator
MALMPKFSSKPLSARGEEILDGLEEIFFAEGFRGVGVGQLAARLHCSRASLYALAASKEELFLRVLDRVLRRIRRLGHDAAAKRADVRDRIVALLSPGMSEMQTASNVLFSDIASLPAARRMLEAHQRARLKETGAIIEEGIGQGKFRGVHTQLVADVLMVAVQRVMDPRQLAENRLSAGEAIGEVEDLFLHGLLHPRVVNRRSRAPKRRRSRDPA